VFTRALVELFRVTLPPAGFIFVTATVIIAALALWARLGLFAMLGLLPLIYAACCGAMLAGVASAKWTIMGRYKPFERPLSVARVADNLNRIIIWFIRYVYLNL